MARPGLEKHPKFRRLLRILGEPRPHVRGYLESLWEVAYENGDPVIGDPEMVEAAAEYPGNPGNLFAALRDCGGTGRVGFIEPVVTDVTDVTDTSVTESQNALWMVHDLFDHAPEYVADRRRNEDERKKAKVCEFCGAKYRSKDARSKYCGSVCKQASYRLRQDDGVTDNVTDVTDVTQPSVTVTDRYGTPAPAPAPALNTNTNDSPKGESSSAEKRAGYPAEFETWWSTYPKKVAKQAAFQSWQRAIKRYRDEHDCDRNAALSTILNAARKFSCSPKAKGEFCPHPAKWLNDSRWDDDPDTWEDSKGSTQSKVPTAEDLKRWNPIDGGLQ